MMIRMSRTPPHAIAIMMNCREIKNLAKLMSWCAIVEVVPFESDELGEIVVVKLKLIVVGGEETGDVV